MGLKGFQPGNQLRKGIKSSHTIEKEAFRKLLIQKVKEDQEPLLKALIDKAKSGDVPALKEILVRVLGNETLPLDAEVRKIILADE